MINPQDLENPQPAQETTDGREEHCIECSSWFLGCLNGREKWKDKAITPNHRTVQLKDGEKSFVCDAFKLHPDPNRRGRAVY